jgi:hypothetical protein
LFSPVVSSIFTIVVVAIAFFRLLAYCVLLIIACLVITQVTVEIATQVQCVLDAAGTDESAIRNSFHAAQHLFAFVQEVLAAAFAIAPFRLSGPYLVQLQAALRLLDFTSPALRRAVLMMDAEAVQLMRDDAAASALEGVASEGQDIIAGLSDMIAVEQHNHHRSRKQRRQAASAPTAAHDVSPCQKDLGPSPAAKGALISDAGRSASQSSAQAIVSELRQRHTAYIHGINGTSPSYLIPASEILQRTFAIPPVNSGRATSVQPVNAESRFHMPQDVLDSIRPVKPRSLASHGIASRDTLFEAQKRQFEKSTTTTV